MKEFTIDRKTWLRGEGDFESRLLRSSDDKMCCLGQFAVSCRVPKHKLIDMASPENVKGLPKSMRFLVDGKAREGYMNSMPCCELMDANDDVTLTEKQREARIKSLFLKQNIVVNFK